jgi:carbamoyl-phosphate synthase/aspartate carbamoyltransferase/dihydroorotase
MLTAVHDGRLTLEQLVERMHTNPRRIFNLPEQPDTWIEVDLKAAGEIHSGGAFTRCGWTPFEGWQTFGQVRKVVLRGREVFQDGEILAPPGYGLNIRATD